MLTPIEASAARAYFRMINDKGGVNRRKIDLITLDDASSPPKTGEQTRKLVEQEEVAAILNPPGTCACNASTALFGDTIGND